MSSERVWPGDGFAERVTHEYGPVDQSCTLCYVRECPVAVVVVEHVVVTVVVGSVEPQEVLIDAVAYEDIDESVVVDVCACDAEC